MTDQYGNCSFCHEVKEHSIHSDNRRIFMHPFDGSVSVDEAVWRAQDAERGVKP